VSATWKYAEVEHVTRGRRHVTAFRPISEAARSWSDDNLNCVENAIKLSPSTNMSETELRIVTSAASFTC